MCSCAKIEGPPHWAFPDPMAPVEASGPMGACVCPVPLAVHPIEIARQPDLPLLEQRHQLPDAIHLGHRGAELDDRERDVARVLLTPDGLHVGLQPYAFVPGPDRSPSPSQFEQRLHALRQIEAVPHHFEQAVIAIAANADGHKHRKV